MWDPTLQDSTPWFVDTEFAFHWALSITKWKNEIVYIAKAFVKEATTPQIESEEVFKTCYFHVEIKKFILAYSHYFLQKIVHIAL